jgi:hypothetical protein
VDLAAGVDPVADADLAVAAVAVAVAVVGAVLVDLRADLRGVIGGDRRPGRRSAGADGTSPRRPVVRRSLRARRHR